MKTLIASKENEHNITQVKIENDGVRTPKKRAAARESDAVNQSLLVLGGFLDSQTGDTQFFEFTQYRCPWYQESQTEDGECEIYSSPSWGPSQEVKQESASPSLSGSPPRKKARIDSLESTPSPCGVNPETRNMVDLDRPKMIQGRREVSKEPERTHGLGLSEESDMRAGLLREQNSVEQETERKAKEVIERLKNLTEELQSLEMEAITERGALEAAESMAAESRKKITQIELVSQTVRKEILEFEGQLGLLVLTKFEKRISPTFGPFITQPVQQSQETHMQTQEDPPHPSVYTQIENAINDGYLPLSAFPSL